MNALIQQTKSVTSSSAPNQMEINQILCNVMADVSNIKELSEIVLSIHKPLKSRLYRYTFVPFRLVCLFNDVAEFSITTIFMYTLLGISAALLTLQTELVE